MYKANLKDHFIIIDGLSLLFRNFHSLIDLTNKDGYGTGMLYGGLKTLLYLFMKYKIDKNKVIFAWDRKPRWKHKLYEGYKAGRTKQDLPPKMSVKVQIKLCEKCFDLLGITQAHCDDMESDDVCAALSKAINQRGWDVVIVSKDHDMYQTLSDKTELLIQEQDSEHFFTKVAFENRFGIPVEKYKLVQTLGGCPTDKVPGIKGVSAETAIDIVKNNPWQRIVMNAQDLVFSKKIHETNFRKNHGSWDRKMCFSLVTLRTDIKPVVKRSVFNEEGLRKLFVFLGFKHYLQPDNFGRIVKVFN